MDKYNLPEQLGSKPDLPDERDHEYIVGAKPPDMPSWKQGYDVEEKYGRLRDDWQGHSYGCGWFGLTNDVEMSIKKHTGKDIQLSQRFGYSQTYLSGGGTSPRDNYKLANKIGIAEDRLMLTNCGENLSEGWLRNKQGLTQEVLENALLWRIGEYQSMPSPDPEQLAYGIFVDNGVGGGYKSGGVMGHFIFHKGYKILHGYNAIKIKDSYPPYDKEIVYKKGKWYLGYLGPEIQLYSHWVSLPGSWATITNMKLIRKKGTDPVYIIAGGKRYWITSWEVVDNFKEMLGFVNLQEAKNSVEEVDIILEPYGGVVGDLSFSQIMKHLFGNL